MTPPRSFLSDNASGVHEDVLQALQRVNTGHAAAYGHDPETERMEALFRQHFGAEARAFVALTGTGANVLALDSLTRPFQAVIAAEQSHLYRDECGAPERFLGSKILPAASQLGKLRPQDVEALLEEPDMVHRVQRRVLSISQATEWGTVYSASEVQALSELCRKRGMMLHVDGARLSNAAAHLGLNLKEVTVDLGVDVLSFGGTKSGLMAAEAIVFLGATGSSDFPYLRKQAMQLASKMRFISAQFVCLLDGDLWWRNARHANTMAANLAEEARTVPEVEIVAPVQTNAVFARLPAEWIAPLQDHTRFLVWDAQQSIVRWVTSFDTQEADVRRFGDRMRALSQQH